MLLALIFCDAQGIVVHAQGQDQYWSGIVGRFLPKVLGLNQQDMDPLAGTPGLELSCSPPDLEGKHVLIHLAPLPRTLNPQGGFVACVLPAPNLGILETEGPPPQATSTLPALDYAIINAVFHDARDAIILVDKALNILVSNRKAQRTYASTTDQTLANINFSSLVHPQDRETVLKALEHLQAGNFWQGSLTTINKTGTPIPVKFKVRCLSTQGAQLYQIMLRDLRRHMALEKNLQKSRQTVAGMNIALKQVLLTVEEEKQELKEGLVQQVREEVLPAVDRLVKEDSPLVREAFKSALQDKIADLSDEHSGPLNVSVLLTPREIDVCRLIQQGWQGRYIADELSISFETLQTHRKNIRHKLGLTGAGISLITFLQQHPPL